MAGRMAHGGRWLVGGLLLALLAAAMVWAFLPRPVPVDTVAVAPADLIVTADGEGETRVRDMYVVSAPVAGRVLRIAVAVGDPIRAGETVLATIVPIDPGFLDARARAQASSEVRRAEAALALAEADRARAEADRVLAAAEGERAERLAVRGIVSDSQLDRTFAALRAAEAAVASQEAAVGVRRSELDAARAALMIPAGPPASGDAAAACCLQVRSPVDGTLLRLRHQSEALVAAGEPLVDLGDLDDLEVVVDLLSTDAVKVRPGQRAIIDQWGGEDLAAAVRRVEPLGFTEVSALGIEEQRVRVVLDFTGPRAARAALGHGYRVRARIVIQQAEGALAVPIGTVFRPPAAPDQDAAAWAVFAVEDGRARLRPITAGVFTERMVEVTAGLSSGDIVLLHPSDRVADGTRVVRRDLE